MDDEIDLRPYLRALLESWHWIAAATVLAAALALGISFLLPPTYEAAALVAVTEPRQVVQFDPRIESATERQPLAAYPELATSDELLRQVLERAVLPAGEVETVQALRRAVDAVAGADASVIRLTVRYQDADQAAALANLWADLFVAWANDIFGDQGGEQVVFFERQLATSQQELAAAEEALVDFQASNRAGIVEDQLQAFRLRQVTYLDSLSQIAVLTTDVEALRQHLDSLSGPDTVTYADQLTALFLQLQVFNAAVEGSLQLDLAAAVPITYATRAEQRTLLQGLAAALATKEAEIERRLTDLEPRILALQREQQQTLSEQNLLIRERDVAEEAYIALARKVEEEKITAQDATSGVRLASRAAAPDDNVAPRKAMNAVLAGGLAFAMAILAIVGLTWWRPMQVG